MTFFYICIPFALEGFPNALTEAMSHSLPVVGFSCTDGVNELIIDNHNGLLSSSSVTDFSYCIQELILSPQKRTLMGLNARESIKKYSPASIYRSWEKVFLSLTTIMRLYFLIKNFVVLCWRCRACLTQVASSLAERRYEVIVVTFDPIGSSSFLYLLKLNLSTYHQ